MMPQSNDELVSRYSSTQVRIAAAAAKAGRDPATVQLLAISKGQSASAIRALAQCGQRDFGENYLQEALPKITDLAGLQLTWHYTGQLQSNKTRAVAEQFAWVHTVDRDRIAHRLNEQRPHYAPPLNVCIQVRLEDEPGKGGVTPDELRALVEHTYPLPRLKLRGLMCIPPPTETFEQQLGYFNRMAAYLRELRSAGFDLDTLSMGMSSDLEAAVTAGATWVRVGTAIFGERLAR